MDTRRITPGTVIAAIALSLLFYAVLLGLLLAFPTVTGHPFSVDWPMLATAAVPVVIAVVLASPIVRAKIGGFELELAGSSATPLQEVFKLDALRVMKSTEADLPGIAASIARTGDRPTILLVRLDERGRWAINFLILRDYVHVLSRVAPLSYIVFVGARDRYLGYMTTERYQARYPRLAVEDLVEEARADPRLTAISHGLLRSDDLGSLREQVRAYILDRYWTSAADGGERSNEITPGNLDRMGARQLFITKPSTKTAYEQIMKADVAGIPVVDRQLRFLGVADKAKIQDEVVAQLLGARREPARSKNDDDLSPEG